MAAFPSIPTLRIFGVCLVLLLSLAGCEKKGGEGVVLSKEYIPAAPKDQPIQDERQLAEEQWKVRVEMRADLRKIDVSLEPAAWDKLKVGDRVNVQYSRGKYTGTIWNSEIK